jgi:hypothetical protein
MQYADGRTILQVRRYATLLHRFRVESMDEVQKIDLLHAIGSHALGELRRLWRRIAGSRQPQCPIQMSVQARGDGLIADEIRIGSDIVTEHTCRL